MFPPEQVSKLPPIKRNHQTKIHFAPSALLSIPFCFAFGSGDVHLNIVRSGDFANALSNLTKAIADVEVLISEMQAHRDPLASHIYSARRVYRGLRDTKSGKRHAMSARISWQRACELGFKGTLEDWERLIAAGE